MPYQIVSSEPDSLAALKARPDARAAELLWVNWPSGAVYYSAAEYWLWAGYEGLLAAVGTTPIEARILAEQPNFFSELLQTSDVADDRITVELWDGDGKINDLIRDYAEGVRVEVFYFFPQINWLTSEAWYSLEYPESLGEYTVRLEAATGFRTPNMRIPRKPLGVVGCSAIFGGRLPSDKIPFNPCPYDRHVGGVVGNLDAGGQPFRSCPKTQAACVARLGDDLSYYGLDSVNESHLVGQSKGSPVRATAKGNETDLAEPRAWVFGGFYKLRRCPVMKITPETNNNHPDKAALRVLGHISRGPIGGIGAQKINGITVTPNNTNIRLGAFRQSPTGFSADISNFSGEAHCYSVIIGGPWTSLTPEQVNYEAEVTQGFQHVIVYSGPTTSARQWSDSRAWVLRTVYEDHTDGLGYAASRFVNEDWLYLHSWGATTVQHKAADGTVTSGPRTRFTGALYGRVAQQQVRDICLFGGFSLPFQFEGKLRIIPLERADLGLAPVFRDDINDSARNIVYEREGEAEVTSVKYTRTRGRNLKFSLKLQFEDSENDHIQRTLLFADEEAIVAEGLNLGEFDIRNPEATYVAVGITTLNEAVRIGWRLLNFGEFDGCTDAGPGLKNRGRVRFVTTWLEAKAAGLHMFKVIRVLSKKIQPRYDNEYFRVSSLRRLSDLRVEVTGREYNDAAHALLEADEQSPGDVITDPGIGGPVTYPGGDLPWDYPRGVAFGSVGTSQDTIYFQLLEQP